MNTSRRLTKKRQQILEVVVTSVAPLGCCDEVLNELEMLVRALPIQTVNGIRELVLAGKFAEVSEILAEPSEMERKYDEYVEAVAAIAAAGAAN